ncbi:MAG: HDOD domain-containing protein, partial [Phycisphaerales bacterium]|nr:HDOD domain-containing protein [Phycisphaerales bacterium]
VIRGSKDEITFDFPDYWRRSIFAASAARRIAIATRSVDPDEAFITALVQDIGMVALWRYYGDRYLQVMDMAGGNHRRLPLLEQKYFNADHGSIGGLMLEGWKFPDYVADTVRLHVASDEEVAANEDLRRTTRLASIVAESLCRDASSGQAPLRAYEERAAAWFDLRRGTAFGLLQSINDHASELSKMFDLKCNSSADVDGLLEEADRIRRDQNLVASDVDAEQDGDIMSRLPDRASMEIRLQSICDEIQDVSMILVGVDSVRELNRDAGADAGDLAVSRATESIVRACREAAGDSATVYRFVGAEMAVVLEGPIAGRAETLAERIRAAVRLSPLTDESVGMRPLTASIGVSVQNGSALGRATPDELTRAAMVALSDARRGGGDQVALFGGATGEDMLAA